MHHTADMAVMKSTEKLSCIRLTKREDLHHRSPITVRCSKPNYNYTTLISCGDSIPSHASKYFFKSLSTNSKTR